MSALFGAEDFAWLNGLRRAHFPIERNQLDAHLTLFHALPPSIETELRGRLSEAARAPAPKARIAGIMNLGRGTALRVDSPALAAVRDGLARAFHGLLSAQDGQGWRPHVTIQNKVEPAVARALQRALEADFVPRPIRIAGLALWRYAGGPWEPVSRHAFRG